MTQTLRDVREEVGAFATVAGHPLAEWQARSVGLDTPTTCIVAPRQSGKSRTLSLLALWWAVRRGNQTVLIISASDEAAKRLLDSITTVATTSPFLAGSVVDDTKSLVVLSNGSTIRSVPASERAIRGWSVDLLLLDEAGMISDDLLAAALPTTAARPDARIVAVSSPLGARGWFYRLHLDGLDANNPHARTFVWKLADSWWISPATIAHARAILPTARFRAEYLGEFTDAADAYFSRDDVLACVCSYPLLAAADARGESITVGCDWGRAYDAHAVVAIGVLDDGGSNPSPVLFVPWLDTSHRTYADQIKVVASLGAKRTTFRSDVWGERPERHHLPNGWTLHDNASTLPQPGSSGYRIQALATETNGVGAMPSEELARRLKGVKVTAVASTQKSKEAFYGRLYGLFSQRKLVLPDHPELVRQLLGLTAERTLTGGLRIEASDANVHDDLADALSLAVGVVGTDAATGHPSDLDDPLNWPQTPDGVLVPPNPRPRRGALRHTGTRPVSW